ncbi:hypothetical protein LuPra_02725 [Luteitalea pratensis]|uniref:Uncharacterized protein n=1 Tax=Luteitalea pratensis TaxID=1855912 RepID=A0A143PN42_LUTPR|nr:hypothetical protein [Luteitalea pratensis]AMY09508.1 hypothetical protein LuPra_02725 [Luteitalea pratensis]
MAKELSWRALLIVAIVGLPEPTLAQSQGAIELLQQLRAEVAQVRNEVQPRRFYVTQDAFRGEHALNACTAGFHMASLWEIFDVTTLKYDTQLGRTLPDSGEGPPAGQRGWIRTGGGSTPFVFGTRPANCAAWTTDLDPGLMAAGTTVALTDTWFPSLIHDSESPPTLYRLDPAEIHPWVAHLNSCTSAVPVWCVQDR